MFHLGVDFVVIQPIYVAVVQQTMQYVGAVVGKATGSVCVTLAQGGSQSTVEEGDPATLIKGQLECIQLRSWSDIQAEHLRLRAHQMVLNTHLL